MNHKLTAVGAIALVLGLLGGGIGGYVIGHRSALGSTDLPVVGRDSAESSPKHEESPESVVDGREWMEESFKETVIPVIDMDDESHLMDMVSMLQCRAAELRNVPGGIHIAVGHPLIHSPDLAEPGFVYQAREVSVLDILDALAEQTGITYSIRPCAVLWGKNVDAEALDREYSVWLSHALNAEGTDGTGVNSSLNFLPPAEP